MVITDLPVETLDQIAGAIDSPTDLENLGATCLQFHLLVAPYHTQFRVIRTPLVSPVWKKLAKDHSLARNVRILDIQSAEVYGHSQEATLDKPVIPAGLEAPQIEALVENSDSDDNDSDEEDRAERARDVAKNVVDLDAERSLVSALKAMSGLTSFQWTRTPPLIDPDQEDDVWATLAKCCPALSSIDVVDREKPFNRALNDDPAYQRPTFKPNFYLLQNLKSFLLKSEAFNFPNAPMPDFTQGAKMLVEKCPDLEVLKLQFSLSANTHSKTIPTASLLSGPTWASLREITLFMFEVDATELSSFLNSHPTIEVLSLSFCPIDGPLSLQPGALPRLKQLIADTPVSYAVLDCTTSTPRPLDTIKGTVINDVFLDKLERSGSGNTLTTLSTSLGRTDSLNHLISRLSRVAPNLEWLYINCSTDVPVDRSLYPVLSQLPKLHTLLGVRFLDSRCEPATKNNETMKELCAACPKLRRLDWYYSNFLDDSVGIVIAREGPAVSWCTRHMIRRHTEGSVYTGWGERGWGTFQL